MIRLFFDRLRLAWEAFTTGSLEHLDILLRRQDARLRILDRHVAGPRTPNTRTEMSATPEVLPFPHTGPTRTPFDS